MNKCPVCGEKMHKGPLEGAEWVCLTCEYNDGSEEEECEI